MGGLASSSTSYIPWNIASIHQGRPPVRPPDPNRLVVGWTLGDDDNNGWWLRQRTNSESKKENSLRIAKHRLRQGCEPKDRHKIIQRPTPGGFDSTATFADTHCLLKKQNHSGSQWNQVETGRWSMPKGKATAKCYLTIPFRPYHCLLGFFKKYKR